MGFIDWSGNKEDHYSDIVAYAKENEKQQKENFGDQLKRNKYSEFFGVPELRKLSKDDVRRVLASEYALLKEKYSFLTGSINSDNQELIYYYHEDLYIFVILSYVNQSTIELNKKIKLCNVLFDKVFKFKADNDAGEVLKSIKVPYYRDNFELCSGRNVRFWQWIGYLSQNNSALGKEYADSYMQFESHLAYYLNLLMPDTGVGNNFPVLRRINERVITNSMSHKAKYPNILDNMHNPLMYKEEEGHQAGADRPDESKENVVYEEDFVTKYNIDKGKISKLIEKADMPSYIECTRELIFCNLPEDIDTEFVNLKNRLVVLNNSLEKFPAEKEPSERFIEYYIPEIIDLTATYIEYMNTGIEDSVINGAKYDIIKSVKALINAINDRLEEIYLYTSMELKARAAAMESIMGQDGFVSPKLKIPGTT